MQDVCLVSSIHGCILLHCIVGGVYCRVAISCSLHGIEGGRASHMVSRRTKFDGHAAFQRT